MMTADQQAITARMTARIADRLPLVRRKTYRRDVGQLLTVIAAHMDVIEASLDRQDAL
jgi:hypothetical protein